MNHSNAFAVILCDGSPPSRELFEQELGETGFLITADGGTKTADQLGRLPDLAIGDFDSYDPSGTAFETVHDTDQETNDLEKALSICLKKGYTRAVILGATGQRLDHTLKNLSVLKQFNHQFESLVIKDNYGDLFLCPKSFSMELEVGRAVSLFPLSGKVTGISTDGLKYQLHGESLENGIRDGTSNEVAESPFSVSFESGDLLLYLPHPEPLGA